MAARMKFLTATAALLAGCDGVLPAAPWTFGRGGHPSSAMPKWKGARAFQPFFLIELLVVIAAMSLLTALPLPALGNAKRAGHSIRRLNDQRTVSTAMQHYSQDNYDYILSSYGPGYTYLASSWGAWWHMLFQDQTFSNYGITVIGDGDIPYTTAKIIMLDMPPAQNRTFGYSKIGYGVFTQGYSVPRKLSRIVKPSRSIWLCDSASSSGPNPGWRNAACGTWMALHYRHPGMTANVSFPDGRGARLLTVSRPVLAMLKELDNGKIKLSVASTDYKDTSPLVLNLDGLWDIESTDTKQPCKAKPEGNSTCAEINYAFDMPTMGYMPIHMTLAPAPRQ